MNEDEIKGAANKVVGTGQEVIGKAVNDQQLEGKGYLNQALGAVQDGYGKVRDKVKDIVDDAPATARGAIDTSRDYARRGSVTIARATGDNNVLVAAVAAGIAGLALGWFAWSRGSRKTGE